MRDNILHFGGIQKQAHRRKTKEEILVEICEALKHMTREDMAAVIVQAATTMDGYQLQGLLPMIQTNKGEKQSR